MRAPTGSLAMIAMTLLLSLDKLRSASAKPVVVDTALGYAVTEGDMDSVGSMLSEVRQHPGHLRREEQPQPMASEVSDLLAANPKHSKNASGKTKEGGFYKTFGSDAEGEKGYLKKSFSKGDHGYKSLDTFHKKLGDRYGFEEHEAFGKGSEGEDKKSKHKQHAKKSDSKKQKDNGDHEGAGTSVESQYADDGNYSGYSGGGGSGEYYSGGGGGEGGEGGDTSSYSESYSSDGEGDGEGSAESYSSDDASGEDGSYY